MIVLIAPEQSLRDEHQLLLRMFESGLSYFHLRKPSMDRAALMEYIEQIDLPFRSRVVLHQYHDLVPKYQLKGVHLQEQYRMDLATDTSEYVHSYRSAGFSCSSSFHDPEVLEACTVDFDYHLLSPIFNAISKPGYAGKGFEVHGIQKCVIGLGGVHQDNLNLIQSMGYKGAGVLGAVWNADDPVRAFQSLQHKASFNE